MQKIHGDEVQVTTPNFKVGDVVAVLRKDYPVSFHRILGIRIDDDEFSNQNGNWTHQYEIIDNGCMMWVKYGYIRRPDEAMEMLRAKQHQSMVQYAKSLESIAAFC